MTGPKVLTLDIETSPHLSWHFDTFRVNINPIQIVEPSRIVCFAAKWEDKRRIIFQHEDQSSHSDMVEHMVRLLDEADVVVTYNGDEFDLPWIEWERKLWGIAKPSPFVSVDLYKVVKKNFKRGPARRSLDYITKQLHLTGKLQHEGYFPLWLAMNSDDPVEAARARRIFTRYNKRDVLTTEELKFALADDITNLPHIALYGDETEVPMSCPACNSENYTRQGFKRTKVRRYPQFKCSDCGKWWSQNRSDMGVSAS